MNRIKLRITLLAALRAVSSMFVAAPAQAADTCHPMPEVVCHTQDGVQKCVVWLIRYGWPDPDCRT